MDYMARYGFTRLEWYVRESTYSLKWGEWANYPVNNLLLNFFSKNIRSERRLGWGHALPSKIVDESHWFYDAVDWFARFRELPKEEFESRQFYIKRFDNKGQIKKKRLIKTFSCKKMAKKLYFKAFKKFLKNCSKYNVLGCHYQVKRNSKNIQ